MKVIVLDSRFNINRYVDAVKGRVTGMDLATSKLGKDVLFHSFERGVSGVAGVDFGMSLVNVDELLRGGYSKKEVEEWNQFLYTHGGLVMNVEENTRVLRSVLGCGA